MEKNYCAIKRFGHVQEIASLFAYCASESAGYLTGVDILCDGGLVVSGVNRDVWLPGYINRWIYDVSFFEIIEKL